MPSLTYNIAQERLYGWIGGFQIDEHAVSGGRGGSTTRGAVNWYLQNNPLATRVHTLPHGFGPLPLGQYTMKRHEPPHPHWVRLTPSHGTLMFGRAGFAIHPPGPTGSHGCIVPDNASVVALILHAIQLVKDAGGPDPALNVVAIGPDLDRKSWTA